MKNIVYLSMGLWIILGCDPKKEPVPADAKGKAFVEIQTPNSTLRIGDSLVVSGRYTNESNQTTVPGFVWSSSNSNVATVSSVGKVSAKAIGQAFIIAEYATQRDTMILTVLPATTAGVSTSTSSGTTTSTTTSNVVSTVIVMAQMSNMTINTTQQLQAKVYNASSVELTGKTIAWTSSDTSILKVTQTGVVTGSKAGNATITASTEGVNSIAYAISVIPNARMGTFSKVGNYSINGTTILKVDAGGNLKIEFSSDFSVSSGPDLFVYLSNVSSGSTVNSRGLLVASLGSTSGARTYTVPSGTGINDYKYVLVHCRQFSSTFGNAELK